MKKILTSIFVLGITLQLAAQVAHPPTGTRPVISSFSPTTGTYGTEITITGSNLGGVNVSTNWKNNLKVDTFTIISSTQIKIKLGGAATAINTKLYVDNANGSDSSSAYFSYTPPAFTNTQWSYLGAAGFSSSYSPIEPGIAVTKTNIPYVVFNDSTKGACVMKYASGTWSKVGGYVSAGKCSHLNIKIDNNNIPYVAYIDSSNSNNITVSKFISGSWVTLGSAGSAGYIHSYTGNYNNIQFDIDNSNNVYVASIDSGDGFIWQNINCFKASTGSWVSNWSGFFADEFFQMDIDKVNGKLWLISSDPNFNYQASLTSLPISNISDIPSYYYYFTTALNGAYDPMVRVDKAGNPKVILQDDDGFERLSYFSLNSGVLSSGSSTKFNHGRAYRPALVFDKYNHPAVAYTDGSYNSNGTVISQDAQSKWNIVGDRGVLPGIVMQNGIAIDTTNTPMVVFKDQTNNRISVMKLRATLSSRINSFAPTASGTGGVITIKGIGFTGTRAVYFNTTVASSFTILNDSTITAVVGAGATGAVSLTTVDGGTASLDGFIYCSAAPVITTAITGPTDVCPYVGRDAITYKIDPVSNATSYSWTPPAGATLVLGQGTNQVTIQYYNGFVSGTISVKAINVCGMLSAAKTLNVSIKVPAAPTISGNANPCPGNIETYVANCPSGVRFNWTVSASVATILSGQGTNTLTIQYKPTFSRATLAVSAVSVCGLTSANGTQVVNKGLRCRVVSPQPVVSNNPSAMEVNIYPNPAAGKFNIAVQGAETSTELHVEVSNASGQVVFRTTVPNPGGNVQLQINQPLPAGLYLVQCRSNGLHLTKKLIITQ